MSSLDTKYDFIQPEFLNILLFQQKNLVIFPYVDLKHLHSLELFAIGYNIVDLDSTMIHNLKEILELETFNSYSQNPSFFFIMNVNAEQLNELINLENIHCVINSNEDVKKYANGNNFIFFNKKTNSFLNYTPKDLTFEESLIASSKNISVLQDKILKIKAIATNLFTELNDKNNIYTLSDILSEIQPKYWDKVITFTHLYYGIEVPEIPENHLSLSQEDKTLNSSFSREYDLIMSKNKYIRKEFVLLIHDYRINHVNSANLGINQLYFPRSLYDYLRTHHWKKEIDEKFLQEWVQMSLTNYQLTEEVLKDFQSIFSALGISDEIISSILTVKTHEKNKQKELKIKEEGDDIFPSAKDAANDQKAGNIPFVYKLPSFKELILIKLESIEALIENGIPSNMRSYLLTETLELLRFIKIHTPTLIDP